MFFIFAIAHLVFDHFSRPDTDQSFCKSSLFRFVLWSEIIEKAYERLSPKAWEKAIAHQLDVSWPFSMVRKHSLLGANAVYQRRPAD
jgi:hypothetical protein